MKSRAENLKGWIEEPFVKNEIIRVLKSAEFPLLLREIAESSAQPIRAANRVLGRLHKKGRVSRHKLPFQRPCYCHKRKAVVPNSARRLLFAYSWVDQTVI